MNEFINTIKELGIKTEEDINLKFHTSGHADICSMKKLQNGVNPKKTVIIHTEDKKNRLNKLKNVIDLKDNEFIEIVLINNEKRFIY